MKRFLLGLAAATTALTAAGSAEAQRWHGGYGYHHGWHGGYGWHHRYGYGPGPYWRPHYYGYHRGWYWRHGRRYHW